MSAISTSRGLLPFGLAYDAGHFELVDNTGGPGYTRSRSGAG